MRLIYLFGGTAVIGALVNETMGKGRFLVTALLCVLWWMLIDAITERSGRR